MAPSKRRLVIGSAMPWVFAMLPGCGSDPVPISAALNVIQRDLQTSGAASLSGDAFGTSEDRKAFAAALFQAQCYYNVADPIVAATVRDYNLTLTGSFTVTGKATGGTITAVPSIGVEFDVASTKSQQIQLPVTFAAISDLPLVYLSQKYSLLDQFEKDTPASDSIANDMRKAALEKIIAGYKRLSEDVQIVISHYDENECKSLAILTQKGEVEPPPPVLQEKKPTIPESLKNALPGL